MLRCLPTAGFPFGGGCVFVFETRWEGGSPLRGGCICWFAGDGALGSSCGAGEGALICSWCFSILRAIDGLFVFSSLKLIPPGQ